MIGVETLVPPNTRNADAVLEVGRGGVAADLRVAAAGDVRQQRGLERRRVGEQRIARHEQRHARRGRDLGLHVRCSRAGDREDALGGRGRAGPVEALAVHQAVMADPRHDLRRTARAEPIPPDALLRGKIARYARGEDYHLVMRDRLVALADRLAAALGRPVASRPCVDSAPVLEREWAERGGLGFVAKNTMVIAPGLGSYVVLGELLVAAPLAPTSPSEPPRPRCGACRSCLDACPTQAFVDAYVLDARRCISYLTIEHHGAIPRELRAAIGTWVFGCDICQEVCPFNAGAGPDAGEVDRLLRPRTLEHALPDLVALASRGANQLRRLVKRSALRR